MVDAEDAEWACNQFGSAEPIDLSKRPSLKRKATNCMPAAPRRVNDRPASTVTLSPQRQAFETFSPEVVAEASENALDHVGSILNYVLEIRR